MNSSALVRLDGSTALDRELVGGKAWSVNQLHRLGLPVPPAFTLTTDVCAHTLRLGHLPAQAIKDLDTGIAYLESALNRGFGSPTRPLFVSVRSGAARSMPGMMDTVLNVGTSTESLAALTLEASPELADDVRARFADQYRRVVGRDAPADVREQLRGAAEAVFRSWNSPRAIAYRRHHGLPDDGGTSVTVQAMVFGNRGPSSGTGVLFTRNPQHGGAEMFGEWLPNAQGEDVVSGRVDPLPLAALAAQLPEVHAQLCRAAERLEREAGDMQDVEFTVENGTLWLLQTRTGKRSPVAAVRLAALFVRDGLITPEQAAARVSRADLVAFRQPRIDPDALGSARLLAQGEPACSGIGVGTIVISADEAERRADAGEPVVLATPTTDPDDIHGMAAAVAVITELGGATSHAAVVSRELGRVCVVGCGPGSLAGLAGQTVTVDGTSGRIYAGALPRIDPDEQDEDLRLVSSWLADLAPAGS